MQDTHSPATQSERQPMYKWIAISTIIIAIGVSGACFTSHQKRTENESCSKDYPLLDQYIDCETINEKIVRVKNLEIEVSRLIEQKKQHNKILRASVFYRDLDSRRWFGINADEHFYPASLLKLPISIAYYKLAEANPEILNKKVTIPENQTDQNAKQYFAVKSNIQPGGEYTIETLLKNRIEYSDNNPIQVLNQNLPAEYSYNVLRDLGLPEPEMYNGKSNWNMTVRLYAGILRTLYITSYLTPAYSQQLLSYLTESKFNDGIRAVIPKNIKVAHKFGEAALLNPDSTVETRVLHDCGIVYNPNNPYIICIMTSGNDIKEMLQTIQDIAKIVDGSVLSDLYEDEKVDIKDDE
ncbi:MAG TPA: class A beta-lactamase-related serine hydrolase [Candidatus Magasanikbacteria bacterium]|nr:class A beta-lactamase-related serine hydrolase [Candidatus Magasanikbacteria bacterium]